MPDEVQQFISSNPCDLLSQAVEILRVALNDAVKTSSKKTTTERTPLTWRADCNNKRRHMRGECGEAESTPVKSPP